MERVSCLGNLFSWNTIAIFVLMIALGTTLSSCNQNTQTNAFDFTSLDSCIDAMVTAQDSIPCAESDREQLPRDYMMYFTDRFDYPTPNLISQKLEYVDMGGYDAILVSLNYADIPINQSSADYTTFVDIAKEMLDGYESLNTIAYAFSLQFNLGDKQISFGVHNGELQLQLSELSTSDFLTLYAEMEPFITTYAQDTDFTLVSFNFVASDFTTHISVDVANETYSYPLLDSTGTTTTNAQIDTAIQDTFDAFGFTIHQPT